MKTTIILIVISVISLTTAYSTEFLSHHITVSFDIPNQQASIQDSGSIRIEKGTNTISLCSSVSPPTFLLDDKEVLLSEVPDSAMTYTFETEEDGTLSFQLSFTAKFNDDVTNARFSNENVGREINGTIIEKGAYLSSSAYFYPQGDESMADFTVTVDIPDSWESISDGNLISSESKGGRKIQTWQNPFLMDGAMIMAAPYIVKSSTVGDVELFCYFFPEDSSLIDGYLAATGRYLQMYNDLIGSYPYKRFTAAENFFPTGYGMPAWTLLGQQVLRLPFIKFTSLGHEVLHNWWGNSVYVDYESGNWCEGLTVYGADYRYKLLKSESDAKDYRKNILKQYVSYVNDGNDFPIRKFTSRTSPETRTIGYNKVMMVFHYIEQLIGTEPFFAACKNVYTNYAGKKVSWSDWIQAFENSSGIDLSNIAPEWLDRTGAPEISLGDIQFEGESVSFTLSQSTNEIYQLEIPVVLSNGEQLFDTTVQLYDKTASYTFTTAFEPSSLAIDPDYHIFRKLYPSEIEPIVSQVMGGENRQVYASLDAFDSFTPIIDFAQNLLSDSTAEVFDLNHLTQLETLVTPIVLNPQELPAFLADRIVISGDSLTFAGQTFPRAGHTFVFSSEAVVPESIGMVILSSDFTSLPRIGQLLPHYGKYSYLVFTKTKNSGKGQWEVTSSPLIVDLVKK